MGATRLEMQRVLSAAQRRESLSKLGAPNFVKCIQLLGLLFQSFDIWPTFNIAHCNDLFEIVELLLAIANDDYE